MGDSLTNVHSNTTPLNLESLRSDFEPSIHVTSGDLKKIIVDKERKMLTAIKISPPDDLTNKKNQREKEWFENSMIFTEFIKYLKDPMFYTFLPETRYSYKVIDDEDEIKKLTSLNDSLINVNTQIAKLLIIFFNSDIKSIFVIYEDRNGDKSNKRRVFLRVTNYEMTENIKNKLNTVGGRRSDHKKHKKSAKRIKHSTKRPSASKSRRIRRNRK